MRNFCYWILLVATLILLLSSCDKQDKTNWDTDLVAPLAFTKLTILNLVKDSIIKLNGDNSISLSYQNTVYELNLADQYIKIPDTSIGQTYKVDSLRLPHIDFSYNVSLGSMANNLIASGQSFLGNYIINKNGKYDSIGGLSNLPVSPFSFNASSYFKTLTLARGYLELFIYNYLPVPIQNVTFEVRNTNSNALLLTDNIPVISSGSYVVRVYPLAGKTVESSLSLKVTSFSTTGTPSGTTVLIDTSSSIFIKGDLGDLRASSADAIFPSQDLVSKYEDITQTIGDRKFTYVDCREGKLNVNITSSVQQPLKLTYKLVGAYNNSGVPLSALSTVAAAPVGQLSTLNQDYDLSGFAINLTGTDGTKFNTYTQVIVAHIDSTGVETQISSSDSLHLEYTLKSIKPNYIKGYAGRDTIKYAGTSSFSITNILNGNGPNALQFDKASLSVTIENGLGIDGRVLINSLKSVNANGNEVALIDRSTSPVIGKGLYIGKARDFPLRPATTTFNITSASSNINDFISNLPTQVKYDVEIKTNPFGNRGTYDDFAYLESRMKVKLAVNIPLSVMANNLILKDSFNFSLGYTQKDVENIKDGTLHLICYNRFPIQTDVTLVAYDENWQLLDTLTTAARIDAADLNTSSCKSDTSKRSVIHIPASAVRIDKMRRAKHAVMTAVFNTKSPANCNGKFINVYSDYTLDAKISADFTYKVKF